MSTKYTTRRTPATGGPYKCCVCGETTLELVLVMAGQLCVTVTCSDDCAQARITELMLRYPPQTSWHPAGPQCPAKAFSGDDLIADIVFTPQTCIGREITYGCFLAPGSTTIETVWQVIRRAELIVQSNGWTFKDRYDNGRMVSSAECASP